MTYLLFHKDLYLEEGKKLNDEHFKHDSIMLENLFTGKKRIYYLRRMESRLNDIE